jgi:outer membrane immunogenic protein
MKLTRVLLSSAAILMLAGAAHAADLVVSEPAPMAVMPSAHDWSGAYVGVFAGYGTGTVDWTGDYSGNGDGVDVDGDFTASGWLLGVDAGANMQMDSFVFGVEGDIAWANINGEGDEIDPQNAPNASVPSGSLNWLGTVRGRAGVALDSVLLYGTAGLAFGGASLSVTNVDDDGDTRDEDFNVAGWTAGFGAEMALSDNVSLKAEYLYTDLSSGDIDLGTTDSGDLTATSDLTLHTFKVGLNYSF